MSTSSPPCFSKLEMESAAISTLMSDLQDKVYFLHYHCLNGRFLLFSRNYFIPFKVSTQQIRLFFWRSLSSCVCPNLKPVNMLFSKQTASVAAVSLLSLCDCFVGSILGGSSSCPSERAALLFMLDTHLLSFQDVCDVWHLIFFFSSSGLCLRLCLFVNFEGSSFMCYRAPHFCERCMFSLSVRVPKGAVRPGSVWPGSHHGVWHSSHRCRPMSQPRLGPSLGRCTGLPWLPLAALLLSEVVGWSLADSPAVTQPGEPLVALAPAGPPHRALGDLCFPVLFGVVSCYFYHVHSVKPLSPFPKLNFVLGWVPVFSQLLQKFLSLCLVPRHKHGPTVLLFFALKCGQSFWFPCLLPEMVSASILCGL